MSDYVELDFSERDVDEISSMGEGEEAIDSVDVSSLDLSSLEFTGQKSWLNTAPLRLISSVTQLKDVVSRIPDGSAVAHDTETTGLNIEIAQLVGVSFAFDDPMEGEVGYYVPIAHARDSHMNLPLQDVLDSMVELGNRVTYLFYNAKFDLGIYRYHGISFPKWQDVQASVFLYDTSKKGIGLKDSSKRFLGQEMIEITELFIEREQEKLNAIYAVESQKYNAMVSAYERAKSFYVDSKDSGQAEVKKPSKKDFILMNKPKLKKLLKSKIEILFDSLSPAQSYLYAAADAYQTLRIHKHLAFVRMSDPEFVASGIKEPSGGQDKIYALENRMVEVLLDMECSKVRMDVDYLKRLLPSLLSDLYYTMDEIYSELGIPKDYPSRADFFYVVTEQPREVVIDLDVPFSTGITEYTGKVGSSPVTFRAIGVDGQPFEDRMPGTYLSHGSEAPLVVSFALNGTPSDGETLLKGQMFYPESDFFLDSPAKIGFLLFTPESAYIDARTGNPIESSTVQLSIGEGGKDKTRDIYIKGLKDRLGNKYDAAETIPIKGRGFQGGTVTEKKGQWSTADDDLKSIAKDYPIIDSILEYRKKKKVISTYVLPLLTIKKSGDGEYYGKFAFRNMATPTGRIAAGTGGGKGSDTGYLKVNAQAIPSTDGATWLDVRKILGGVSHEL